MFFYWIFFSNVQVVEYHLEKFRAKNNSPRIRIPVRIRKKKFVDPNPNTEEMILDLQHCISV
jgi:hypothetical protein